MAEIKHLSSRSRCCPRAILVVIVLAALPSSSLAVEKESAAGLWGLVGALWMEVGDELAAGAQGELGYRTGRYYFGGRILDVSEVDLLNWGSSERPRRLLELGPVVGVRYGWKFLRVQGNIGVSILSGRLVEELDRSGSQAVGVPVEIGLFVAVNRRLGIGMGATGNLAARSFGGMLVFLMLTG